MVMAIILKGEIVNDGENVIITSQDLQMIYEYLNENNYKIFDENEKFKMIKRLLKKGNDYHINNARIDFPQIFNNEMLLWKISDMFIDENALYFALYTDTIENIPFRNSPQLILRSTFGSYKIQIFNNKILIFMFCPYADRWILKRPLKEILEDKNIKISSVKWDSDHLKTIRNNDSSKNISEKIDGIETRVKATITAPDGLENTQIGPELESQGNLKQIYFISRNYPGNTIKIDGENGIITTDLDETQTISYVRNILNLSNF
ncbi:MAG: hypothetical protein ACP5IB_09905 [Thermoplasmata archaeon]